MINFILSGPVYQTRVPYFKICQSGYFMMVNIYIRIHQLFLYLFYTTFACDLDPGHTNLDFASFNPHQNGEHLW
jgi:hypothetical protein